MSFSDKFPDWSVFSERPAPFEVELLSPASEVAALLQRYSTDMNKARQEIESIRSDGLNIIANQAVFIVQLETALERYESVLKQASLERIHKHFRIIKEQMLNSIKDAGLEVDIPTEKPFNEVADFVSVDGWRHNEIFSSEVVAEVIEPIISYHGKLLRPGRVVMGAPMERSTDQIITDNIENNKESK